MRAPSVPEQLFGAVVALALTYTVGLGVLAIALATPALQFAIVPVGLAFGFWLRTTWVTMRMQHRLAAAWADAQRRQADELAGGAMTEADARKVLGNREENTP